VEGEGGGEDHQRQQSELTLAARYLANSKIWNNKGNGKQATQ